MFPALNVTDRIVFIYEGQPSPSSSNAAFDVWFGIGIIDVAILIALFMDSAIAGPYGAGGAKGE